MRERVQPPRVINIEDLRRVAKRRLPRVVFDYIDGGAEAELTLRANCRAFRRRDIDVRSAHDSARNISLNAAHSCAGRQ